MSGASAFPADTFISSTTTASAADTYWVQQITARVVANRLDARPEGWRTIFRPQTVCDVCGEPCKRSDVARYNGFTYVGDGFSDRCVAQAATRVFARDGLATYLGECGVAFEPFVDFIQLERAL